MYSLMVPFKDYKGRPHNEEAQFNLDAREVFRMLPELKNVFDWMESNKNADIRELTTEEVRDFYTSFEDILLQAWGVMDDDAMHFRKGGKYDFEESALFNGCMVLFVNDPPRTTKLLEGLLPPELFDAVKNAKPEDLAAATVARAEDQAAEIARLRAEIAQRDASSPPA